MLEVRKKEHKERAAKLHASLKRSKNSSWICKRGMRNPKMWKAMLEKENLSTELATLYVALLPYSFAKEN